VSDFHEEVKASVLKKLKELAGFAFLPLGTMIEVTAGSVVVVATFPVDTREEAVTAQRRLASYSGAAGQERFEAAVGTILATVGASVEGVFMVEVEEDPKPTKGYVVRPVAFGWPMVAFPVALCGVYLCRSRRKSPRLASTPAMPSDRTSKIEPDGVVDVESLGQAPGATVYQGDL